VVVIGVAVIVVMVMVMGVTVHVLVGVVVAVVVAVAMRVVVIVPVFEDRLHARGHRDFAGGLRIELLAEKQHQDRSEEREQRDKPDLV
jgi:MFS superfamily sulfate permease-like transporter